MATCSWLSAGHKLTTYAEHKVGVGLVDFLMNQSTDPSTNKSYPAWNVRNIKQYPDYARDQKIGAPPKIWVLKTNQHTAGKVKIAPTYLFLFAAGVGR